MQILTKIKKIVDQIVAWINIILLGCMTVLVTYQVIVRYFFSAPSAKAESMAQYMFVWTIMFGSAYAFGLKAHLEISTVKNKLSPVLRLIDDWLIDLTLVVFSTGVMLFGGWALTKQEMGSIDAALQIPNGVIYASIPICAVITIFYAVYLFMDDFHAYKEKVNGKGEV